MMRRAALIALLALAACNRHGVADVTLDADAAQRNATAAKTLADLAAADAASQGPAPIIRAPAPTAATAKPAAPEEEAEEPAEADEGAELAGNSD
jgi:hypothetical protein